MSKRISQFNSATIPLSGGETLLLNQNGVTYSTPLSNVKVYSVESTVSSLSSTFALKNNTNIFTYPQTIQGTLSATNIYVNSNLILRNPTSSSTSIGITTTTGLGSVTNLFLVGDGAGNGALSANNSNFIGTNTGINAISANNSNFFGNNAGSYSFGANNSNFFGNNVGVFANNANNSNFFGNGAGILATNANNSNFFGDSAGGSAIGANNSNFFGAYAGVDATNANNSNFFGNGAGNGATNANNSNFLGSNAGYGATNVNNSQFIGERSGRFITNGSNNIMIGLSSGTTNPNISSISSSIALGTGATVTGSNQLSLGSASNPLSVIPGTTFAGSISGLKVRINGVFYTIPLLA